MIGRGKATRGQYLLDFALLWRPFLQSSPILQFLRYGLVVVFNVVMWACYVNSLKALSSLQATVTNFATHFISSGLAGFFLFQEAISYKWVAGALLIVIGVFILSKSGIEKVRTD
ncbi:hypothetical protein QN277_006208 [Acacia crassicarpa]|uniref:EamA domain-containing protein n=1 Tax=Acacia crassicarpa TaxID=499986 RepID=A0AAE1MC29_9FABA|nr:hypothetical protein QN277_006208 [Acacia crassicarpa]